MKYFPSNFVVESLRSIFKRRVGDAIPAYLGDTHGTGARVDVPGKPGFVYVHFPSGKDASGFALYSPPTIARSGQAAYLNYPGAGVYVGYGYDGELEIKGAQYRFLDQAGINTSTLNPLNQQSKWVYPWQLTYGLTMAVANSVTASTLVTVKKLRHFVGNLLTAFDTPLAADKIDLAAYIPAADTHCYAAVWIDTYTNLPVVTTSIAQAMTTPLDATDLQELVVRAASSRPADGIPLKAFYLSNAQTTITQSSLDVDLRQFLDNPVPWGFPTTLTTLERVRPGYTLVTGPYTASGVGALTIESGGKVIIVHKSNVTNTAPTINDDSGDGYSIGSLWFDTATGLLYVASDVTVGAAVWEEVASSGSTPPFVDTTAIVKGSVDATKLLRFEVDGNTTATTRVLTPPDYDGTIATLAGAETLANKVLSQLHLLIGGFKAIFTHSNTADRTYTLPNYNGTLATLAGTENFDNKTLNGSSIGVSTSAAGYFSALRLLIGGWYGIFTHANSANRTYTLPNYNGTLSTLAGTETLTNKTLTQPAIGDYTNAVHTHVTVAGGGEIPLAALLQSGAVDGDVVAWNNGSGVWLPVSPKNLIAIFRDEKTSGTAGGSSAATTWNARDLNTELYDPGSIVSIASNQFTPVAGDYEILVFAPFVGNLTTATLGRSRLYNVTAAASVEEGMNTNSPANTFGTTILQCAFTANGTDAYRIDTYTSLARATAGLGAAVSDGSAEVYTCVYLRKVA